MGPFEWLLVLWVIFAIGIGWAAGNQDRSGLGWFLVAVLISPLLALVVLLAVGPSDGLRLELAKAQAPAALSAATAVRDANELGAWQVRQSDVDQLHQSEYVDLRVEAGLPEARRPGAGGSELVVSVEFDDVSTIGSGQIAFALPGGRVRLAAPRSLTGVRMGRISATSGASTG